MIVMMSSDTDELEQLVRDLNSPFNQGLPDKIHAIQKQIQTIQRNSSAWQAGLMLLDHGDPQMRFYGALTLTIKVNADWEKDKIGEDRQLLNGFLEKLVTSYVKIAASDEASFVVYKLCTTLVAVFQKPDSAWALPMRHILACTIAGRYLHQEDTPPLSELLKSSGSISVRSLRAIIFLALNLAEDAGRITDTSRSSGVHIRMSNNTNDVWQLILFCTDYALSTIQGSRNKDRYGLQVNASVHEWVDVAKLSMQIAPLWSSAIKTKSVKKQANGVLTVDDTVRLSLINFMQLFSHNLDNTVVQTFTLLEQTSHTLLQYAISGYANEILKSPQVGSWIQALLTGDFGPDPVAYVEFLEALMNQVDVTSPEYLGNPLYPEILRQLGVLLHCEGVAGVEDTVCQAVLEIMTTVIEGFGDWPGPSPFDESMKSIVAESCSSAITKSRMPLEEMKASTQTWDTDDRAKFQDYRFDVQDFLLNAFAVLGNVLIEEIVKSIISLDNPGNWEVFEANLYNLQAFSDTVAGEPDKYDQYIEAIFSCNRWVTAVSEASQTPERVRQQMIKFIGENTAFLQRHSQNLVSSLNFLFESLYVPGSATAASKAIFTLCDTQRTALTEALPTFMQTLGTAVNLELDARNRIFAGVAAVVQGLPNEHARLQPLASILDLVELLTSQVLNDGIDPIEISTRSAGVMFTLAAIGRGLRSPTEVIDVEATNIATDARFWTDEEGSSIQQRTLQIYKMLRDFASNNSEAIFVEATCDFLRSAFTEEQPSPFKFPSAINVAILSSYIQASNPRSDLVMGTVSSYLASVKLETSDSGVVAILENVTQVCQTTLSEQHGQAYISNAEFCTAALGFFTRLLPKWSGVWLGRPELQKTIPIILEIALILISDPDTLTRRTATSFFIALLEASGSRTVTNDSNAATSIQSIIQSYGPRIIGTMMRLLGGECARSELEILTELLRKFVQKQPLIAYRLIKESMKNESGVLTTKALEATKIEQRARFAAQIETLRGGRKSNEVVREFWVSCRGSSFGYIA